MAIDAISSAVWWDYGTTNRGQCKVDKQMLCMSGVKETDQEKEPLNHVFFRKRAITSESTTKRNCRKEGRGLLQKSPILAILAEKFDT